MFRHPRVCVPGPETLPFLGGRKCSWKSQDITEKEVTVNVLGIGMGHDCGLRGILQWE